LEALSDDLNTPQAMTELHALDSKGDFARLGPTLRALGFVSRPASRKTVDDAKVEGLISARLAARKSKNFAEADRIREELTTMGVVLKDSKEGTTWELAR
jgi:cysteinyl-tRNA synthetase